MSVHLNIRVLYMGPEKFDDGAATDSRYKALSILTKSDNSKAFTYHAYEHMARGTLVTVPFGSEVRLGVVTGPAMKSEVEQVRGRVTMSGHAVHIKDVIARRDDISEQLAQFELQQQEETK